MVPTNGQTFKQNKSITSANKPLNIMLSVCICEEVEPIYVCKNTLLEARKRIHSTIVHLDSVYFQAVNREIQEIKKLVKDNTIEAKSGRAVSNLFIV